MYSVGDVRRHSSKASCEPSNRRSRYLEISGLSLCVRGWVLLLHLYNLYSLLDHLE